MDGTFASVWLEVVYIKPRTQIIIHFDVGGMHFQSNAFFGSFLFTNLNAVGLLLESFFAIFPFALRAINVWKYSS